MQSSRIFVSGLYSGVTQQDIENRFSKYGQVKSVEIKERKSDDEDIVLSTFAFINLQASKDELSKCFNQLSGTTWKGSQLRVQPAKESFLDRLKQERLELEQNKKQTPTKATSNQTSNDEGLKNKDEGSFLYNKRKVDWDRNENKVDDSQEYNQWDDKNWNKRSKDKKTGDSEQNNVKWEERDSGKYSYSEDIKKEEEYGNVRWKTDDYSNQHEQVPYELDNGINGISEYEDERFKIDERFFKDDEGGIDDRPGEATDKGGSIRKVKEEGKTKKKKEGGSMDAPAAAVSDKQYYEVSDTLKSALAEKTGGTFSFSEMFAEKQADYKYSVQDEEFEPFDIRDSYEQQESSRSNRTRFYEQSGDDWKELDPKDENQTAPKKGWTRRTDFDKYRYPEDQSETFFVGEDDERLAIGTSFFQPQNDLDARRGEWQERRSHLFQCCKNVHRQAVKRRRERALADRGVDTRFKRHFKHQHFFKNLNSKMVKKSEFLSVALKKLKT